MTAGGVIALIKALAGGGGGGGGVALVVTDTDGTLDKTWQEIHDAAPLVWYYHDGVDYCLLCSCGSYQGTYYVTFRFIEGNDVFTFITSSADGYPVLAEG